MSRTPSAVADTNVAISAFLSPHSTSALAIASLQSTHRLLGSIETINELHEVMMRDKFAFIPAAKRQMLLEDFIDVLDIIQPHRDIAICVDPKDDKFLSLAVSGNANLILSGDEHLLQLHPFQGIDILKPKAYLESVEIAAPR